MASDSTPTRSARAGHPRVTIVDVAKAAGVQPSTVSKVMNDHRGSADVQRRVREAATRLGYRPDQRARGLRRSESRSVGVLIQDLANPVFLPFLRGIESTARARGYVVLIADGQRSTEVETAALERFFDQGVDGLVLAGPVTTNALDFFLDHDIPVATATDGPNKQRAIRWERGEAAATRQMAERLLELGHRSFAFVGTPMPKGRRGERYRRSRLGSLTQTLRAANADLIVPVIDPASPDGDAVVAPIDAITQQRSTAVICGSHLLAPRLLSALDHAGLRIPHDVSFVVYGDSDWARAYRPPLSVICHDTYTEGCALAASLLNRIAGVNPPPPPAIATEYIERSSCDRPPTRHRGNEP
jgi:LacI family transcriptional regulator